MSYISGLCLLNCYISFLFHFIIQKGRLISGLLFLCSLGDTSMCFYCAMHYSAKRSLAIACHLSVRPSVMLVDFDHIGWNSSEIISPLVTLGCSLSADPNIMGLLQGEHPEILAQSDPPCWFEHRRHSIANCGQMVTDSATVTMESLQETTIALSNGAIADPLRPPLPQNGDSICPKIRKWPYLRNRWSDTLHVWFRVGFSGSADQMALFPVTSNPSWRQATILDNFEWLYLRNGSFDPLI